MRRIAIDLQSQRLRLFEGDRELRCYPVSTARNGPGEEWGSGCTPRGRHAIRLKIGQGMAINTVFRGRRPTGERFSEALAERYPERDWILSRILWLTGCESGFNRGGHRDTLRRFIYIHGTPPREPIGSPASHGCIRMRNEDVMDLFEQVGVGTPVDIA